MDCGSIVDQIAEMARPYVTAGIAAGEDMILHGVSYGWLVEMVFGPNIVQGYANQAITYLENIDDAWVVTVQDDGSMMSKAEITIINMINKYEANLVAGMGDKFIPWVKAEIAKFVPTAKAAA